VLVTAEMALALVLLVGAGLMVRSFLKVSRAQLGIDSSNVLTMRIELPARKYPNPDDQSAFHDRLAADLGALPGVDTVAIGALMPTGGSWSMPYELDGAPVDVQHRPTLSMFAIGPSYFKVWRVALQRGRFFEETDTEAAPPVVMVNEAFAARLWSGQDPLGRRLRTFLGSAPEPWRTVVGVVPNIVHNNRAPQQDPDPVVYVPLRQWIRVSGVAVILRTRVPPGTLATKVRRATQTLDADVPIYNLWTMEERLLRNYWFDRLMGTLFAIFAGLALLVAAVGL
jgi:putative ABC transport system permease protein